MGMTDRGKRLRVTWKVYNGVQRRCPSHSVTSLLKQRIWMWLEQAARLESLLVDSLPY